MFLRQQPILHTSTSPKFQSLELNTRQSIKKEKKKKGKQESRRRKKLKQSHGHHPTSPSLGPWLAVTLFFISKPQVRDGPKWFKVTNGYHGIIYCSSTLLSATASISENDTLAVELASGMKVPTTASWLSMPKSSYKKLCYNMLNNPYWHEKGLTANFDLPQQILTCQKNCGFILKQTELLSVQSVEAIDN